MNLFAQLIAKFVAAVDSAIDAANGDVVEAMHGHVCNADCWHNTWLPGQDFRWLACPTDNKEHAFPARIVDGPKKRYYAACGEVHLTEPLYLLGRVRCETCHERVNRWPPSPKGS